MRAYSVSRRGWDCIYILTPVGIYFFGGGEGMRAEGALWPYVSLSGFNMGGFFGVERG